MTQLIVRKILIDLKHPFDRHWCGGDPFKTAFFNALSMGFPLGEQFFINAVKAGFDTLNVNQREECAKEVQNFVGQEATHRRIHSLFNEHLKNQGLENIWGISQIERQKFLYSLPPIHRVAATAANEHLTAILAHWVLISENLFPNTEERLKTLWNWHCSEELEHRATAFDLYKKMGGTLAMREKFFRVSTLLLIKNISKQTLHNLRQDKSLWKIKTWVCAFKFFLGMKGMVSNVVQPWKNYLKPDFHPMTSDDSMAERWLVNNSGKFSPVSA